MENNIYNDSIDIGFQNIEKKDNGLYEYNDITENIEQNIDMEINTIDEKKGLIQEFLEMLNTKLQQKHINNYEIDKKEKENYEYESNLQYENKVEEHFESDFENNIETYIENNFENQELIQEKLLEEKTLVIDRFEGDIAVCENRKTQEIENIDIKNLPANIKEGDILKLKNNEYQIDTEAREEAENRINEKLKNLFTD